MNLYYAGINGGTYKTEEVPEKERLTSSCSWKISNDCGVIQLNRDRTEITGKIGGYWGWITQYPSNCGFCILSGVSDASPKQVVNTLIKLCRDMGYSQVHYSTATNKEAGYNGLLKTLMSVGFVKLEGSEIINRRSGNTLATYILNLNVQEQENANT